MSIWDYCVHSGSIRDGVHSGLCPFGMVPIRDYCVHSRLLCPFGINASIWDYCVHSGLLCPFGIHLGWCPFEMVSIRDCVHSGLCPFGMVSIRDGVHSGWCPFGIIVSIRDFVFIWDYCVHSGLCPFGQLSGYHCVYRYQLVSNAKKCVFIATVLYTNSLSMMFLTKATQYNYRLVIVTHHHIFFTFLASKFLSFLSNLLSIENDLTTATEVGWFFCNSA